MIHNQPQDSVNAAKGTALTVRRVAAYGSIFIVLIIFFYPSLDYPFSMDAIHLIRPYSLKEILSAWSGHWDPDNIETAGWRPLYPLFLYGEWLLFRSSGIALRLGLILVITAMLANLNGLFQRFTGDRGLSLAAVFLTATAMSNCYHVTFLSDGIHMWALLFLVISTRLFVRSLKGSYLIEILGAFFFYITALLVREEAISWSLALPLIGILVFYHRGIIPWRRIFWIFFGVMLVNSTYLFLRHVLLKQVKYPGGILLLPGCTYGNSDYWNAIKTTFLPFDVPVSWLAYVVIGVLIGMSLIFAPRRERIRNMLVIGIIMCCLAHTVVIYRSNVVYTAVPFFSLLVALSVWELIKPRVIRFLLISVFCLLGTLSAYQREITFHPRAITSLAWDLDVQEMLLAGAHADPDVAADLKERLSYFGLLCANGKPNRVAMKNLKTNIVTQSAITWPWEIPGSGAFIPEKDPWW